MQSVEGLVNVEEWIQTHLNKRGATQPYQWKGIVEDWERLQSLAEKESKNAYKMSINELNGLEERIQRTKLQWILAKLGSKEGYSSWIPLKDRTKTHEGQSLGSLSLEKLPSSEKYSEIEKNIKLIDVIWLENDKFFQIFKIGFNKTKENFSSKFIEIADFSILTKIPFNLVVDKSLGKKVEKELLRPTFKEIRLSNRCFIMTAIKDWVEAWETENLNLIKKNDFVC
jgi:hypothetical protein